MKLGRRTFLAAVAGVALFGAARSYYWVDVTELDADTLPAPLPRGLRAAYVSDLHVHRRVPVWLVEAVSSLEPDLLLIGGDVWDELSGWPPSAAVETLRRLAEAAGEAYAVLGNHEHWAARRHSVDPVRYAERLYEEAGIKLLADEDTVAGAGLRLCGVDWRDDASAYMEAAGMARERGCRLVLSHSPDVFHYADPSWPALYLAGHTHGGQWCLPGAHTVVTNSVYGFGWGLYRRGEAVMYVSRGVGEMLPPRLFCPKQIIVLRG